jgi:cell division septal protein FtsQ
MTSYQGRALRAERGGRETGGRLRRVLVMLGLVALATAVAMVPWEGLRRRYAVLDGLRIEGAHYLDVAEVARIAGLKEGQDLIALDLVRTRQRLMFHPRIARAEVTRRFPRGLRVRIVEREPVLLVRHGEPWEMDASGVLLPPLAAGVTADVPLLGGIDLAALRPGAQVGGPAVQRALEWVRALDAKDLRLAGEVSEIDVGQPRMTQLLLMDGTRVMAPAWPPAARPLSALRVVLQDLRGQGTAAREVDIRFDNQVIVRPAVLAGDASAAAPRRGQSG